MARQLALFGGTPVVDIPGPHFVWPVITAAIREAVDQQLSRAISLYDRSDVFDRFERRFAEYHGRRYALLNSSGTVSLLAMYFGAGLVPGDEVICPVYAFPATVSPLVALGVRPVFCDCSEDGNLDATRLEDLITERTKAIVVTHMWGVPCDMDAVNEVARRRRLLLFEDCSHAHGARYKERLVGTFGDAAVWSLQGQKTVTGGEGGILLTDHAELHYRAVALGHYNKRFRQEIPGDHPLFRFGLTGFGLKLRAHPLAIAIACCLLDDLERILAGRAAIATFMTERLGVNRCLRFTSLTNRTPSWYALTFLLDSGELHGARVETFFRALRSEGLAEVDRPSSTRPVHNEPLFREPEIAFPWSAGSAARLGEYPSASQVHNSIIKLPVWHETSHQRMAELYCEGIEKVIAHGDELAG